MDEPTTNETMPEETQTAEVEETETEAQLEVETEGNFEAEEPEPEAVFSWHASEYVHHHKGVSWYVGLTTVVVLLLAIAIIFKLWLSIGVFVVMGAAIAVYAHKPPRTLQYKLDSASITIDTKSYPYHNFRSFSVVSDVDWHTIELEPTQRFMPRLSILFSDEEFDSITEHLAQHLPRTDRKPDAIERATRYLRF